MDEGWLRPAARYLALESVAALRVALLLAGDNLIKNKKKKLWSND
jgi:hypothetical protein